MQMFAHRATEAGIRRIQQERISKPDPMLTLVSEIQDLKRRLSALESKPAEVVYLPPREPHRTPFKKIEMRVCKLFGYTPSQLRSNTRNKRVVLARQFVFYWALRVTTLSTTQIGKLVGGLDHTTVLHGRDAYRKKRAKMGRNLREVR